MKAEEESKKAGSKLKIQKTKIMASSPITSWQIDGGKVGNSQISYSWAPKSMWMVAAATKLKDTCFLEEKLMTNLDSILNSIALCQQSCHGFSSSHVWM